ncbi:phage minor head protein [Novosphingobium colocasiae]|uniref:phage head morphogenesis protein n=1 Tax=Novosphingobium colocasiae TaxID=1256513 RepID=UPI0035B3C3E7
MRDGEPVTLPPIRPAAPIRERYEGRLAAEVDAMQRAIIRAITAAWRANTPETVLMGSDETATSALQKALNALARKWLKRFDDLSDELAGHFTNAVRDRCDRTLQDQIRRGGFSVRFKMTAPMRDAFNAVRAENVGLIRSVGEQHLAKVETLVMQSVSRGRDLKTLTAELHKQTGVTKRRAAHIALHQNNMATATMRSVRERELGVSEGIWLHSGGGREPRASHKAFSGQRFNLAEGHDFGDGFGRVLPGQAINCRCTWKAILPGFG